MTERQKALELAKGSPERARFFLLDICDALIEAESELSTCRTEAKRLREALNTPEVNDFAKGIVSEAQHQRERWGSDHDAGKQPEDWYWLLGYLGGKCLAAQKSGDLEKALHHQHWSCRLFAEVASTGCMPAKAPCKTCGDDPDWTGTADDGIRCPDCQLAKERV